jgi:hypothetical protein
VAQREASRAEPGLTNENEPRMVRA